MIPMSHAGIRFVDFTIIGVMVHMFLWNPCWSKDLFVPCILMPFYVVVVVVVVV